MGQRASGRLGYALTIAQVLASILGTANQITVTINPDGTITLSIPDPFRPPGDVELLAGQLIIQADTESEGIFLSGTLNNIDSPRLLIESDSQTAANAGEIAFLESDPDFGFKLIHNADTVSNIADCLEFVSRSGGTDTVIAAVDDDALILKKALGLTITAGGTVAAGEVIVPSPTAGRGIISPSTSLTSVIGVALTGATIGNDFNMAIGGKFTVIVDNTVNVGDFLETATVAGRARSSGTSGGTGDFAIALSAGVQDGTVTAVFKKAEVF